MSNNERARVRAERSESEALVSVRPEHAKNETSASLAAAPRPYTGRSLLEMDPRLEELLKQASRADGIPVVFVTRSNRPLWLIMPAVTPPDDAHWKTLGSCASRDKFVARSDQARWLKALGALHNYVEKPFVGHWEVPHTWRVPLGVRLLSRFHGYYVVERFESAAASARHCWTQVSWKNHKLQYRLVTKLNVSSERRERRGAMR